MKKLLIALLMFLIATPVLASGDATVIQTITGFRKTVVIGDEKAFDGGFILETAEMRGDLGDGMLGVQPFRPSGFETTLSSQLAEEGSEATLVVNSLTLPDDSTLDNDKYGDLLILTVGEGDSEEKIAVGALAESTKTFTVISRGLLYGEWASSTANMHQHLPGERVYVSNDDHFLYNQYFQLDNPQEISTTTTFLVKPVYGSDLSVDSSDSGKTIITKEYVDTLTNQGAATGTEAVPGIWRGATQEQMASSTGSSASYNLLLQSQYATSSRGTTGHYVPITELDGNLNNNFIGKDQDYDWTGDHTSTGETTLASTTINSVVTFEASTTWKTLPEYDSDPIGGDEPTRKSYVDALIGKKTWIKATEMTNFTSYAAVGNFNVGRANDATDPLISTSVQVPKGATSIASVKLAFDRASVGLLYLSFSFAQVDFASSSAFTTDTQALATYPGGAADNSLGIITIPSSAYNGLTLTADDLLGFKMQRAGSNGADTYDANWDVYGMEIIFN